MAAWATRSPWSIFSVVMVKDVLITISLSGNRDMLQQYIEKVAEGDSKGKYHYQCTICGKMNGQKIHTENHIESIHFPGSFEYKCKYCAMTFPGRNMMYMHVNKIHKGEAY